MAFASPVPIINFNDYPLVAVRIVEQTIAEVIASRALYPFRPTQVIPTRNGYYAW